jgi:branched-chain amino acid transport system ATP-binding protein
MAFLIRAEIWRCLARLKAEGQSIPVIDRSLDALLRLADHHTILERAASSGKAAPPSSRPGPKCSTHLGV